MAIDAAIASNATGVIRDATVAVRPAADWDRVEALLRQIDEAVDRGDEPRVERLIAELESLAQLPPKRRRGGPVIVAIVVVALVLFLVGIVQSGNDDETGTSTAPTSATSSSDSTSATDSSDSDGDFDFGAGDGDTSDGDFDFGAGDGDTVGSDEGDEDTGGDSSSNGLLIGISIAAAVLLVVAGWLFLKRRPASDERQRGQADSRSVRSLPRVPASDETIELANHTIHHLGLETS